MVTSSNLLGSMPLEHAFRMFNPSAVEIKNKFQHWITIVL